VVPFVLIGVADPARSRSTSPTSSGMRSNATSAARVARVRWSARRGCRVSVLSAGVRRLSSAS